ncbi:MAG: hypothetical protein DME87_09750 [Verrucomicrobia bacterium]|nr:MAG: hypothetical protein DME87_09750 [Verrucomicrobiota bacterium]
MAHRIVLHVVPLLSIGFGPAQLPIPILALPNRDLGTTRPCSRNVIFPIRDSALERLGGNSIRRAEQMDVIGHNDIATDTPEVRCSPRLDD